jgi:hypothetical protein
LFDDLERFPSALKLNHRSANFSGVLVVRAVDKTNRSWRVKSITSGGYWPERTTPAAFAPDRKA